MEAIHNFIMSIDGVLGGVILVVLLFGTGIFFTIKLKGVQFVHFGRGFKMMFGGIFNKAEDKEGSLSSFQALATAVAAQVGTGNVGGVATAIATGGPGAVFWMWITALLGMPTIFAEAVLAQHYRKKKDNGELVGGPAYYIEQGVGPKVGKGFARFLAVFFAIAIVIALGITGNMVQSNSISNALNGAFNIPLWISGIALAILAALIFIGGVDRIGRFAETVVPVMAVAYIIAAIAALVIFRDKLGGAFQRIFEGAFTVQAGIGGFAGATVRAAIKMGVQRGLFSNEAGMGSTPHAHAVAHVKHPVEQGLVAFVGVFVDTLLVCSATALTIVATEAYQIEGLQGVAISQEAFTLAFGPIGGKFLAVCLLFFAFTTIVGWYYFGESNIFYLFGQTGVRIYQGFVIIAIILGSLAEVQIVWDINGFLNNLMVIPNVIALLILSPLVSKIYEDYNNCLKNGKIHYEYNAK